MNQEDQTKMMGFMIHLKEQGSSNSIDLSSLEDKGEAWGEKITRISNTTALEIWNELRNEILIKNLNLDQIQK